MISMTVSRNSDKAKFEECKKARDEIIKTVGDSNNEFQDCFYRLLMAEYKEYIYGNLFDPCFEHIEQGILSEYEIFMEASENKYILSEYAKHDPKHYIFSDRKIPHDFYEAIESKGYDILSMWESEDYLQEYLDEEYYV